MLSRVAESVYWMSRLVERAENVARFIGVNLHLSLDAPGAGGGEANQGEQWRPLVTTSGDAAAFDQRYGGFDDERGGATRANVIRFLATDEHNPNSIRSCLAAARENARTVRECISEEMWEHLNRFHLMVAEACEPGGAIDPAARGLGGAGNGADPLEFFETVRRAGQQFLGVTDATMSHGEAWQFCRLGRTIERADKTTRILDVKYYLLLPDGQVGSSFDAIQWAALLRSAGALQMYRQRFGKIDPPDVVDFLVLDREFPRSVLHCLVQADAALHRITGRPVGTFGDRAEQRLGRLHADLAFTRPDEVVGRGLHEFLDDLQVRLNAAGRSVQDTFFLPTVL